MLQSVNSCPRRCSLTCAFSCSRVDCYLVSRTTACCTKRQPPPHFCKPDDARRASFNYCRPTCNIVQSFHVFASNLRCLPGLHRQHNLAAQASHVPPFLPPLPPSLVRGAHQSTTPLLRIKHSSCVGTLWICSCSTYDCGRPAFPLQTLPNPLSS